MLVANELKLGPQLCINKLYLPVKFQHCNSNYSLTENCKTPKFAESAFRLEKDCSLILKNYIN